MADHPKLAAVQAELSAAADASGAVGTGTFLRIAFGILKARIDTEEERDAIIAALLSLADVWVAPRFGPAWVVVRPGLETILDEAGDKLPDLIPA